MTSGLKAIALILVGAVMICVFAFYAMWVIAFLLFCLFVLVIFAIAYFCNITFSVTREGKKIGTYTRKGGFKPL
jgi:hypothetical protein